VPELGAYQLVVFVANPRRGPDQVGDGVIAEIVSVGERSALRPEYRTVLLTQFRKQARFADFGFGHQSGNPTHAPLERFQNLSEGCQLLNSPNQFGGDPVLGPKSSPIKPGNSRAEVTHPLWMGATRKHLGGGDRRPRRTSLIAGRLCGPRSWKTGVAFGLDSD